MVLFGLILVGTSCASCTWMSLSFLGTKEVSSCCVFKYVLCSSLFSWDPCNSDINMLDVIIHRSLELSSFLKFFLLFSLSDFHYLSFSSLICSSAPFNILLIPCWSYFPFQFLCSSSLFGFVYLSKLSVRNFCSSSLLPNSLNTFTVVT